MYIAQASAPAPGNTGSGAEWCKRPETEKVADDEESECRETEMWCVVQVVHICFLKKLV